MVSNKIINLFVSVMLVFSLALIAGCAKDAPMDLTPKPIHPKSDMPKLGDVEHELPVDDITGGDDVPETDDSETVDPSELRNLDEFVEDIKVPQVGTRLHSDVSDSVDVKAPEGSLLITADKIMVPDSVSVVVGETVIWKNKDSEPHLMLLERDGVRIATGARIEPGQIYSYTFTEAGEYLVRDMFAGSVRGTVIVK